MNRWFTHKINQTAREALNTQSVCHTFVHTFSDRCGGASVGNTSCNIQCWVSSNSSSISWIFRVQFSASAYLKQRTKSEFWCYTRFVQNSRRVFTSISSFSKEKYRILWRHRSSTSARVSNGAVQPPLHRTPQAVAVSECFGSSNCYESVLCVSSEKFGFGCIFRSAVAFSNHRRNLAGRSKAPVNWDR